MITRKELHKHWKKDDCWIAIHGQVYDFSSIFEWHSNTPLANYAGKDATEYFDSIHPISFLNDFKPVGVYYPEQKNIES